MLRFKGSLAAVVADDLVDLEDDVLGNLGLYGIAIDHLDESDALFVTLCRGDLAEHFELLGYNYTDEITGNVLFPRSIFLQSDDVSRHDDWRKRLIGVDAHEIEVASHWERHRYLVAGRYRLPVAVLARFKVRVVEQFFFNCFYARFKRLASAQILIALSCVQPCSTYAVFLAE